MDFLHEFAVRDLFLKERSGSQTGCVGAPAGDKKMPLVYEYTQTLAVGPASSTRTTSKRAASSMTTSALGSQTPRDRSTSKSIALPKPPLLAIGCGVC